MTGESIDYESLVRSALRGVARAALARAAESGLPGEHHFYIAIRTGAPGVVVPKRLRDRFPREMTIVLQHQFRDLEVTEDRFAVTLSFGGRSERISAPFAAIASFADPSAQFALRFEKPDPAEEEGAKEGAAEEAKAAAAAPAERDGAESAAADGGTVVAVDFGRGKRGRGR